MPVRQPDKCRGRKRRLVLRAACCIYLGSIVAGGVASTQVPPTFRSGVELIELDILAEDRTGRPIRGLSRDDFEVSQDGQRIPIATFRAIDSDGGSPADSRYVILLLDDVVTAPVRTSNIKALGRAFANRMHRYDVGAVLMLNGSTFSTTRDRAAMLDAVGQFRYRGPSLAARFNDYALDTIGDISRQLIAVEHRRKTLVYIGAAEIFEPSVPVGRSAMQRTYSQAWFEASAAAAKANVGVYIIDPAGLTGGRYDGAKTFAAETGGLAITNSNQLDASVERVWQEASNYYLIGCELPSTARPMSSLKVRSRARTFTVRTRQASRRD